MRRYEVGDYVRVRDDLIADRVYGSAYFTDEMRKYLGESVKIRKLQDHRAYNIEGDHSYVITDEMILCKVGAPLDQKTQPSMKEIDLEKKVDELSQTVLLLKKELEELKAHVMPTTVGTQRKVIQLK